MAGSEASAPVIPDGGVLLHIGMHKTGTTAIQTVLAASRSDLAEHGVNYPGTRTGHHREARALIGASVGAGGADAAPAEQVWTDFAAEIAAEERRVAISSEFFSGARGDQPARLVADLGGDRVQVVVGVRNLPAVGVSTWQQTLKQGRISTIDEWAVQHIPRDGGPPPNVDYWSHWDLGAMVRRWAEAVTPDRMTVLVLDGQDRTLLPGVFEQLLGLPAGLLASRSPARTNRGMTAAEAEMVRRVNQAVYGEFAWPEYRRLVREGLVRAMVEGRVPGAEEAKPVLPDWAEQSMRAAGARAAEEIRASGVRVIGDLALLHEAARRDGSAATPEEVTIDAAVRAIVGLLRKSKPPPPPPPRPVRVEPSTRELAAQLARRVRRRAARAVRPRRG